MSTPKLNLNKQILALFSGQASMVTTPKLYIQLTGSHTLAIVLSQCVFWSNKSESGDGWFYKRYDEWFEEIHVPERTLRRRFDHLEMQGWITTKVKKVRGTNIKHIHPNMDLIIDSLNNMLNKDCPDRPNSPDGPQNEQKPCTKITPTGQSGRSEPAKLSDSSIYTEDYEQKKLTNCVSSSSFLFSETTDRNLLNQKLNRDTRTDEEFMAQCLQHVENCSDKKFPVLQRANALVKLLKQLKASNVIFRETEGQQEKKKNELANETDEQRQERQFFTYELIKERESPDYVSNALKKYPEMRAKYEKYARQG